ncbi:MAG TPA: hypothetical protein VK821_05780, partial [Dehalococcoidia bacterium]|nr:hypothetical protein [Dehalococcoidia bacterium]
MAAATSKSSPTTDPSRVDTSSFSGSADKVPTTSCSALLPLDRQPDSAYRPGDCYRVTLDHREANVFTFGYQGHGFLAITSATVSELVLR